MAGRLLKGQAPGGRIAHNSIEELAETGSLFFFRSFLEVFP
jgi:hypothetical protein